MFDRNELSVMRTGMNSTGSVAAGSHHQMSPDIAADDVSAHSRNLSYAGFRVFSNVRGNEWISVHVL